MTNGLLSLGTYAIAVKFENSANEYYYAGKDHGRCSYGPETVAKDYKRHRNAVNQLCEMRRLRPFGDNVSFFLRKLHFNRETMQFSYEPCNEY